MTIYTGSGVAIVTPFLEDGSIDFEAFEQLIEFQISNGTDAIIVAGTTGESATMNDEEQLELIEFAVKRVNGRVPVIAGTGSNNTAHAYELCVEAEELGVDALLVVTPYYNKTSQHGLIEHFTALANSVEIPIILYNVPGRTGQVMTVDTIKKLAEIPNVVGYKDATGDIAHTMQVIRECGDKLDVYSGNDDLNVPIILLGGKGTISVLANAYPQATANMCKLALDRKVDEAVALQQKYNPFISLLFAEPNPMPIKECVANLGYGEVNYRLPMVNVTKELAEKLKVAMENL